jgi:hypothetical protein
MMFRKYSADGQEAGRYGPRSIMPARGLTPGGASIGAWRLRVADDRVGALAESGNSGLANQVWIVPGIECFDRGTGVWKDAGHAPVSGLLLGAQGDELVFSQNEGLIRLYWVKVP